MLDSFPPISGDCNFWTRMTIIPMKSTKLICRKIQWEDMRNKQHLGKRSTVHSFSSRLITHHNWSQHRSLDHPPDGSVVIHVPTAERGGKKNNNQDMKRRSSTRESILLFITYPISSKCSLSTAQMVTHTVGVPVVIIKEERRRSESNPAAH